MSYVPSLYALFPTYLSNHSYLLAANVIPFCDVILCNIQSSLSLCILPRASVYRYQYVLTPSMHPNTRLSIGKFQSVFWCLFYTLLDLTSIFHVSSRHRRYCPQPDLDDDGRRPSVCIP